MAKIKLALATNQKYESSVIQGVSFVLLGDTVASKMRETFGTVSNLNIDYTNLPKDSKEKKEELSKRATLALSKNGSAIESIMKTSVREKCGEIHDLELELEGKDIPIRSGIELVDFMENHKKVNFSTGGVLFDLFTEIYNCISDVDMEAIESEKKQ